MKSCTDIEQSRKLAEILPIESADMRYGYIAPYDYSDRMYDGGYDEIPYPKDFLIKNPNFSANEYDAELPCWSLAALLNLCPTINEKQPILTRGKITRLWYCYYEDETDTQTYDNSVDAVFEMIQLLHEQKLL
jgi:hypothetical protein